MVTYTFKLRAECFGDMLELQELLYKNTDNKLEFCVEIDKYNLKIEFQFNCSLCLKKIKSLISTIQDSHVMYETVQPLELYTGRR